MRRLLLMGERRIFYGYYCPICGHLTQDELDFCTCYLCGHQVRYRRTIHDWWYYRDKALDRYDENGENTILSIMGDIVIEEEASKCPEFSREERDRVDSPEEHAARIERFKKEYRDLLEMQREQQRQVNMPKCPTCGSTDIQKISTASKVVGASLFGLFSRTAKSQFKCNKCGYKW